MVFWLDHPSRDSRPWGSVMLPELAQDNLVPEEQNSNCSQTSLPLTSWLSSNFAIKMTQEILCSLFPFYMVMRLKNPPNCQNMLLSLAYKPKIAWYNESNLFCKTWASRSLFYPFKLMQVYLYFCHISFHSTLVITVSEWISGSFQSICIFSSKNSRCKHVFLAKKSWICPTTVIYQYPLQLGMLFISR